MALEHCSFTAPLVARYLLHVPDVVDQGTLLVLTLHGYGSNPEAMLRLTTNLLGARHVVAALQGPYQFYLDPEAFQSGIGYGWGTRNDTAGSIRLHHSMVLHVLEELGARFGLGPERALLAGFSQPVSMNYRLAAAHPAAVRGLLAICGGLPGDWIAQPPAGLRAAVLHIARDEDRYYPTEVALEFADRLRRYAADVEFHMLPGGHRVPSKAAGIVRSWVARVFADAAERIAKPAGGQA